MAFADLESSTEGGRPVALYEFTMGSTVWRYTSADEDLVVGGQTYVRAAIQDDGVKQSGEAIADALQIQGPVTLGPAQVFMSGAPSQPILVSIRWMHEGDSEVRVVYTGEISQINYPMPGQARITCETLASSMRREGLRLAWQRTCPYSLYDPLTCRVNKSAWGVTFTVRGISGRTVYVTFASSKPAGYYNGGFVEWQHPTRGIEYLGIDREGDTSGFVGPLPGDPLEMDGLPNNLYVGSTGIAYPGCNFTPERCQFFGNYDNYGGFPLMPGKSPFDGDPVFY
jgi:hypothetical protein